MAELSSPWPLRDLFDAAVRHSAVRLACPRCGHERVFRSAALWWLFKRKGWPDRFSEVRARFHCRACAGDGARVRADLALVDEPPTDDTLPMPLEIEWKRERRRRR